MAAHHRTRNPRTSNHSGRTVLDFRQDVRGVEGIDRLLIDLYAVFGAVQPNGPAHCHQDLAGMQDFEHRSERPAALGPTARSLHPWIEQ